MKNDVNEDVKTGVKNHVKCGVKDRSLTACEGVGRTNSATRSSTILDDAVRQRSSSTPLDNAPNAAPTQFSRADGVRHRAPWRWLRHPR